MSLICKLVIGKLVNLSSRKGKKIPDGPKLMMVLFELKIWHFSSKYCLFMVDRGHSFVNFSLDCQVIVEEIAVATD